MIEVRPFRSEDEATLEAVCASATATLRLVYRPTQKALANKSRISRDLERVVALADGRIVGTAQYYEDSGSLRILGLGVLEEYRRKGVARALIEALADIALSRNLEGLAAGTVRETGNVPMFERLGFRVVSEEPDDYSESDIHGQLSHVELRKTGASGSGLAK